MPTGPSTYDRRAGVERRDGSPADPSAFDADEQLERSRSRRASSAPTAIEYGFRCRVSVLRDEHGLTRRRSRRGGRPRSRRTMRDPRVWRAPSRMGQRQEHGATMIAMALRHAPARRDPDCVAWRRGRRDDARRLCASRAPAAWVEFSGRYDAWWMDRIWPGAWARRGSRFSGPGSRDRVRTGSSRELRLLSAECWSAGHSTFGLAPASQDPDSRLPQLDRR